MGKEQVAKVKAKELVVHPWSMSATGQWDKETGLTELRQYAEGKIPVAEIVDMLWEPGAYVQNSAVAELLQHGN